MSALPSPTPSVFISYSSKDKDAADAVRETLLANDITPWMAPYSLRAGENWSEGIIHGLSQCRVVVLVFSQHANDSAQVRREVERGFERGLHVLPVFIEDVVLHPSMEYYISNVHWIVAKEGLNEEHLTDVIQRVTTILNSKEDVPEETVVHNPVHSSTASAPPYHPTYPNNLPQSPSSFIGREKHRQALAQHLEQHRIVTLTAMGGSGKTRLALQVAQDVLPQYPDGVWFVELAPLSDPTLVPQAVAAQVGAREQAGQTITQTLIEHLREKHLLLVIDNAEHLVSACASLVATLLRSCSEVKILVTSRETLGVSGEQIYRVPPMSLPTPAQAKTATASRLAQFESVQLFVERARLVKSNFEITDANASALAHLCYHLDGIPLAIELAAARIRSLAVEQIDDKLDSRFRLLTGGDRSALPRQQTLRALIDWSYDLLNETEKILLARLSVFAGGWTLEATEAICVGDPVEDWEILDLLTSLTDKSLILTEETPDQQATRYRMLETIRQYGKELLAGSGEEATVRERHIDFFVALAAEARSKMGGPEELQWLTRLEAEHDNLRAALDNCAAESTDKAALSGLRLSGTLWYFWHVRSHLSEGREQLTRSLAKWQQADQSAEAADPAVKRIVADALQGAGMLAYIQGDYSAVHSLLEHGLALYREMDNKLGIGGTLGIMGHAAAKFGDYVAARSQLEESLVVFREIGNKWGIGRGLEGLGRTALNQGDYATARSLYEECLPLFREISNKPGIADALLGLGDATSKQGDYAAARSFYEESLSLNRAIGNRVGISKGLEGMATVCATTRADAELAVMLWAAATTLRNSIGLPQPLNEKIAQATSLAQARTLMNDDAAWNAASAEGAVLPWEQAVKLALRE